MAIERLSGESSGLEPGDNAFDAPLPEPPGPAHEVVFEEGPLHGLRRFVAEHGARAGLAPAQMADLVLAVNEVATNSLRHGGGRGLLRIWQDGDALICEIRDWGRTWNPLAGRERPTTETEGGRGLWLANQLCDVVQLQSFPTGSIVRLHMQLP